MPTSFGRKLWAMLGKRAFERDRRRLRLAGLLEAAPRLPGNGTRGDFLVAGGAHEKLHIESLEQAPVLARRDAALLRARVREGGSGEQGLSGFASLKKLRTRGRKKAGAGGRALDHELLGHMLSRL
jgi:hypothetical protein